MELTNTFLPTCRRGNVPPCENVCPFGLPVRDFIKKYQRGNLDAAFKEFRNAVVFPEIASAICGKTCEKPCSEYTKRSAIQLSLLEKACIENANSLELQAIYLPDKSEQIAIIGGGPSGLACALRLAYRKYKVTIYESTERIGGSLWESLPAELIERDLENQFKNIKCEIKLNHKITDIAELEKEYDAFYIATGTGGNSFSLNPVAGAGLATDAARKLCGGGKLFGTSTALSIKQGTLAADSIEHFLKTSSFKELVFEEGELSTILQDSSRETTRVENSAECFNTKQEAIAEADRCDGCDCDICFRNCIFMQEFNKYPEKIISDAYETVNPTSYLVKSLVATRMLSSCSDCGLCRQLCPEGIDIGSMLMASRQEMVDKGDLPPPFHAFPLRDFEFSNSDEASIVLPAEKDAPCKLLFFPGCQLGATHPYQVIEAYSWLRSVEPLTGLMLLCCGIPAYWGGKSDSFTNNLALIKREWELMGRPQLVTACPTCTRILENYLPEISKISIYELLAKDSSILIPQVSDCQESQLAIFDACSSREFPDMQNSIRLLLDNSDIPYEELQYNGKEALCCNWGGHISIANPSLGEKIMERNISQSDAGYVTYCGVCTDKFLSSGKQSSHILELIFPGDRISVATQLNEKYDNRKKLKADLLRKFWKIETPKPLKEAELFFSSELNKKMTDNLILEKDILSLITQAEATGVKMYAKDTDSFFAHLQVGHYTYWAEYRNVPRGYLLLNTYSHRMEIDSPKQRQNEY